MDHSEAVWRDEVNWSADEAFDDRWCRVRNDQKGTRQDAYDCSVGRCIAYLAVNPPTEKVVTLGNAEILDMAQKYKESGGKA